MKNLFLMMQHPEPCEMRWLLQVDWKASYQINSQTN